MIRLYFKRLVSCESNVNEHRKSLAVNSIESFLKVKNRTNKSIKSMKKERAIKKKGERKQFSHRLKQSSSSSILNVNYNRKIMKSCIEDKIKKNR